MSSQDVVIEETAPAPAALSQQALLVFDEQHEQLAQQVARNQSAWAASVAPFEVSEKAADDAAPEESAEAAAAAPIAQPPPYCSYCGKIIADEFILGVLDQTFHANCLRCSDCAEPLTDRCFVLNPLPLDPTQHPPQFLHFFCRDDFLKRSGARCPRCGQIFGEGDLVRKAQHFTFHAHCFACVACQRELSTGQLFYVLNDSTLLCKFHYETAKERQNRLLMQAGANLSASEAAYLAMSTSMGASSVWGDAAMSLLRGPLGLGALCGPGSGPGSVNGGEGLKRPRTTINSLQLELLRRAYETSSKPPRHVREQLSQDTGLDMRVVQVWFQNKRAKEKRMKKDPSSSMTGGSSLFGGGANDGSSTGSFHFDRSRHLHEPGDNDDGSVSGCSADESLAPSFDEDAGDDFVVT